MIHWCKTIILVKRFLNGFNEIYYFHLVDTVKISFSHDIIEEFLRGKTFGRLI